MITIPQNVEQLAKFIDQTLLQPNVTDEKLEKFCEESAKYHFKIVAVNSVTVRKCKDFLKDSDVLVGAAIGFPLGQTKIAVKVFETQEAINDGADEIDYVINIAELKNRNLAYIEDEMTQIVSICKKYGKTSKVILENCYLTEEEKKIICEIACKVRPDFVKTSTGFATGGATIQDVKLMKSVVGDRVKIKAAGGIRSLKQMMDMIEAGAERIGTSRGVEIMEEFRRLETMKPAN